MVKWFGALCIFLSSGWLGMEISRKMAERTRQLRLFIAALESLEAEILFGHFHLQAASQRIAKQIEKPIGTFFELFANKLAKDDVTAKEAWKESLEEHWNQTALSKAEWEILLQFGETLGRHDINQQQKQIRLAIHHLGREEKESYRRQSTYGKIANNIGFLSGLLLILLLL